MSQMQQIAYLSQYPVAEALVRGIFDPSCQSIRLNDGRVRRILTSQSGLRSVEVDGLLYMEQNPNKTSEFAQLARQGHQIIWIIHRQSNSWIGRIQDGVLYARQN